MVARPLTHANSPLRIRGWDTGWYVGAAEHGWAHGGNVVAFFPALPELIRIVHGTGVWDWSDSANAAALLTQVAMAVAVWLLTKDLWGVGTADRATVLLCVFPGAYVFSLIYTEPLFIAAGAACLLALRRRQWVLAGLFASLAGATRIDGLAFAVCCRVGSRTGLAEGSPGVAVPLLGPDRAHGGGGLVRLSVAVDRQGDGLDDGGEERLGYPHRPGRLRKNRGSGDAQRLQRPERGGDARVGSGSRSSCSPC